jgi:hypothetical protein
MPKNDATPEGRSQKLTSAPGDMVSLDRKTCHELGKLVGRSIDALQTIRHCEIIITSLEHHLSELEDKELAKSPDIAKALLLLQYWLDFVPETHTEIDGWLTKAFQTLQIVLATSELGGAMNKPMVSHRRIDQLRAIAFNCGFLNEDPKQFGKLSKTATWEALLETYGIPPQVVDIVDSFVDTVDNVLDD